MTQKLMAGESVSLKTDQKVPDAHEDRGVDPEEVGLGLAAGPGVVAGPGPGVGPGPGAGPVGGRVGPGPGVAARAGADPGPPNPTSPSLGLAAEARAGVEAKANPNPRADPDRHPQQKTRIRRKTTRMIELKLIRNDVNTIYPMYRCKDWPSERDEIHYV